MWNTLKEFKTQNSNVRASTLVSGLQKTDIKPHILSEIIHQEKDRFTTGFSEMDSVLGGGIVPEALFYWPGIRE